MSSSEGKRGWSEMWNSTLINIKGAQEAVTKSSDSNMWNYTKTYGGVVLAAGAALYAVPCVIGVLGFTAGGIAAGTLAAKAMSASAVANGGGVAAGGVVATLQSIGAAGFGIAGKTVIAGTSGGLYKYACAGTPSTKNTEED